MLIQQVHALLLVVQPHLSFDPRHEHLGTTGQPPEHEAETKAAYVGCMRLVYAVTAVAFVLGASTSSARRAARAIGYQNADKRNFCVQLTHS